MYPLDLDKAYISPYDKFLFTFDAEHEKSASQQKEIQKHRRIAQLRDKERAHNDQSGVWDAF
jgi:hypothetical protein